MLKVVLVDDEDIIREGIAASIPWETLGFIIAGQAEDGEQALQVIQETQPDLVITDIKMPFIDGLKLIERIKPHYPQMYIVIISGHDEFQYAQKALKLGAYDYILKPIDPEYLQVLLRNIRADAAERQKKEYEVVTLKQKMAANLPVLREQFFNNLIHDNLDASEIPSQIEDLQIEIDPVTSYCVVIVIQLDDYYIVTKDMDERPRRELEKSFWKIIHGICENEQMTVIHSHAIYEPVIVIYHQNPAFLENRLNSLLIEIHYKVNAQLRKTLTIGVGNLYCSFQCVRQSYQEALEILDYKFILGKNRDLYYKDRELPPQNGLKLIDYDENALVSAIRLGNKKVLQELLADLMEGIKTKGGSHLYMQMLISDIYVKSLKILKEAGGAAGEVFNDPLEVYHQMIAYQTAEDMTQQLLEVLQKIIDYIYLRHSNKFYQTIEKAKDFLKLNYAKDDLTLEEVAKHVHMGPCYFSFIFKQEVGTNFSDFLNQIRLEKAKELLVVSNNKNYEVSYMVGYNNPTYFSTIFKKYMGISPSDYKNKFAKTETKE